MIYDKQVLGFEALGIIEAAAAEFTLGWLADAAEAGELTEAIREVAASERAARVIIASAADELMTVLLAASRSQSIGEIQARSDGFVYGIAIGRELEQRRGEKP